MTDILKVKVNGEWVSIPAIKGDPGQDGQDGQDGADGIGVPSGGTQGQTLAKKTNTDYDTEWIDTVKSVQGVEPINGDVLVTGSNIMVNTPVELPSGYTQVEYISSDGSQFIDTGWNYTTYPVTFECTFIVDSALGGSGGYPVVYGLQTSSFSNWIYPFYINDGNFNLHLGGSASIDFIPCTYNRTYKTSFTIDNGTWTRTINGHTTTGTWSGSITSSANMFLFGGSYGPNPINQLTGKASDFKIIEGYSTVARNYRACRRDSDGVYGMYDLANNTFKSSDSSVAFTGGNVVRGLTLATNIPRYISQFANDAGYTGNVGTVTSVNNTPPDNNGNVSINTGGTWGSITGTLSNQTDLNTALTGKVSTASCQEIYPVVQKYRSGTSWYRIYSDGWCEMGGRYTNSSAGTVVYLKTFADANYTLEGTCMTTVASACYDDEFPNNPTTTGFSYNRNSNRTYSWYACGQLASGQY